MLFDFETLSARNQYKLLISTVVPRPIAWVVTQNREGELNAAPIAFFNVVCDDPPTVCLGVGAMAGVRKDTSRNILETGEFVINMVAADLALQMNTTAIDFPPEVDELEMAGLTTLPSHHVAPPRIAESPVSLECKRVQAIEMNNNAVLFLGRIMAIHVRDDAVIDRDLCYIDTPALDIVARMHGNGWFTKTTDRFEMGWVTYQQWQNGERPGAPVPERSAHFDPRFDE